MALARLAGHGGAAFLAEGGKGRVVQTRQGFLACLPTVKSPPGLLAIVR